MNRLIVAACFFLSACGWFGATAPAPQPTPEPKPPIAEQPVKPPTQSGVMLSAYPDCDSEACKQAFIATVGKLASFMDYESPDAMPQPIDAADIAAGEVPIISWTGILSNGQTMLFTDILNHKCDAMLTKDALATAALGGTPIVQLLFEPKSASHARWYGSLPQSQWAAQYVAVYRYIHDLFVKTGAANVLWAYSPNGDPYALTNKGTVVDAAWYPGDAYVNIIGLHAYQNNDAPSPFPTTPIANFCKNAHLLSSHSSVQLGLFETGATSKTAAQETWIKTMQAWIDAGNCPGLIVVSWFNHDGKAPTPGHSLLDVLAGNGLRAFQVMMADPKFQRTGP